MNISVAYFMQLFNRMTAQLQLSCDLVTLSEHQGHSNWNQTVMFRCVYHHIRFQTNWFTGVMKQYNVDHIFYKIMSAEFSPLNIACA